jgi:hypothetical protein
MLITAFRPTPSSTDRGAPQQQPFWTTHPTWEHVTIFSGDDATWLYNTMSTPSPPRSSRSSAASPLRAGPSASRWQAYRHGIFVTYLVPPTLLFIPADISGLPAG